MSVLPWFEFYPSDWLAGTRGLSAVETGVYITLISMIYEREGPVPADTERLARACGCTKSAFKNAVEALIEECKIFVTDEGYHNDRAQKEIEKRSEKSRKAQQSANARWNKNSEKTQQNQLSENATAQESHMRMACETHANQNQNQSYIEDTNVSSCDPAPANQISEAVSEYNAAADRSGWPKVQKLTPARSKAIRARLNDAGGIDGWRIAMSKAEESDFLCGRTMKPWAGFGFDWITKQANFTKLMEGNYDNRSSNSNSQADTGIDVHYVAGRMRRSSAKPQF